MPAPMQFLRPTAAASLSVAVVLLGTADADAFPAPRIHVGPTVPIPIPVGGSTWPSGPGMTEPKGPPMERAQATVKKVRNSLADREKLDLVLANSRVKYAEELVEAQRKIAHSNGNEKRAVALEHIVKDVQEGRRHIAAHKIDDAVVALGHALKGIDHVLTPPKTETPKKETPKK